MVDKRPGMELRVWHLFVVAVTLVMVGFAGGQFLTLRHRADTSAAQAEGAAFARGVADGLRRASERSQAEDDASAAQANLRAAVPGMEAYNADHATGYAGVTLTKLQESYDAGIENVAIVKANSTTYCVENSAPTTVTYHKSGPGAEIAPGVC